MIFSSPKKKSKMPWVLLLMALIALGVGAVYLWWRGQEQPAPPLLSSAHEETHIPIEHWISKQGMKVLLVSTDALPIIDMRLIFSAGSARDGALSGLAQLTSDVLLQGSEQFNAEQIAERIDNAGAFMTASINRDMMSVSYRSLSEPQLFEQAFSTLTAVLSKPTFPPEVVTREQQRLLLSLKEEQQYPHYVGLKAFNAALYGDHPYAQAVSGTPETVAKITQADIAAFAQRHLVIQNAVLAIVGDLSIDQAKQLVERLENVIPTGAPLSALPTPEPLTTATELNIPFESTQAHILFGGLGMRMDDPNFFPLYVGNYILGGRGLVSLLFNKVREERGLAYSANSSFVPLQQTGPFMINSQTRVEATEEVISVIRETLQDFVTNGPTLEQVSNAQSHITGNFALQLDSNAAVVDQLGMMAFYDLPMDYMASFNAHVLAVTPEQVKEAFQKHIDLNHTVLVTVGYAP